jgi:hypothetical protein
MRVSTFSLYLALDLLFVSAYCRLGTGCPKQEKVLTSEHTMLRRHAAVIHLVRATQYFV